MWCEDCKIHMVRSVLVQGEYANGYSTIFQYECPQCELKIRKVADNA
jgi:hypothetical protein